jgi:hypothetical protein
MSPVKTEGPEPFSRVVVVGAIVLTMVVVLGLLVLIAPSAGAAGGCGGG